LLVVEDDEMSQRAWQALFARRGWDVVIAGTLAGGLALLTPVPDYLILDLLLPDGDGLAILGKIRADGLKTLVSVTTGTCDPARLVIVRGFQPEGLFEKPVDIVDVWRVGELAKVGWTRCQRFIEVGESDCGTT